MIMMHCFLFYGCLSRFLLNKTIDVLLYVDRLDAYRVDTLDGQIVKAISNSFGQQIWRKAIVVLTHAQLSPPDCLSYDEFLAKRSEALLKVVYRGARFRKLDIEVRLFFKITILPLPMPTYFLQYFITFSGGLKDCNFCSNLALCFDCVKCKLFVLIK